MKEEEKSLDPQLWHVCAGSMVQIPTVNSTAFYFPQGHVEHAQVASNVDFSGRRVPPQVVCRVESVKFLAERETDEIYAKIRLIPLPKNNHSVEFENGGVLGSESRAGTKISENSGSSFAKTLTQSDANNGGGFSVPRYCAETIFPPLDYDADPPVQMIVVKDIHGETWKFRHIYRGTPRRHLLTTGWSSFVHRKKLVAGDSIVFLKSENGDLCAGIRRAKRDAIGFRSGLDCEFSEFWRRGDEDETKLMEGVKEKAETVMEAVALASSGQVFDVVYYPRGGTSEFCVKAAAVMAAMRIPWSSGMRFKKAFETEDSSRISWHMGTVSAAQVADPRWPNSPWNLLQVAWDEPDLLPNLNRVNPWVVELVSEIPGLQFSTFSPAKKKLRLQPYDFSVDGSVPVLSFPGNNHHPVTPIIGIQGARHAQYGTSFSDFHLSNQLQTSMLLSGFEQFKHSRNLSDAQEPSGNVSCLLTVGNSGYSQNFEKKPTDKKTRQFFLFGTPILTEQQMCSSNAMKIEETKDEKSSLVHEVEQCKVFMESEDLGRTLDLSALRSYDELYQKLANMFGIESSEMPTRVLYRDATGKDKLTGDEPFSDFIKTAKRLTILMKSGNGNDKTWLSGIGNGKPRLLDHIRVM